MTTDRTVGKLEFIAPKQSSKWWSDGVLAHSTLLVSSNFGPLLSLQSWLNMLNWPSIAISYIPMPTIYDPHFFIIFWSVPLFHFCPMARPGFFWTRHDLGSSGQKMWVSSNLQVRVAPCDQLAQIPDLYTDTWIQITYDTLYVNRCMKSYSIYNYI